MINVGDKVRIKHISYPEIYEYPFGWDSEMNRTMGEIGIVQSVQEDRYRVRVNGRLWSYRLQDVKLARRIVTPKIVCND